MNMIQIGYAMILVPVSVAVFFAVGTMLMLMSVYTIKAYINRDIAILVTMAFIWSFVIGVVFVLVGSV